MIEKVLTVTAAARLKTGEMSAGISPTAAYCLPAEAVNAMDTAKMWALIIAVTFAIVGLILIGIGMFFQHRRGDGGEVLKSLGWWIGGVILVSAAAGITSIFLNAPTDCIPRI